MANQTFKTEKSGLGDRVRTKEPEKKDHVRVADASLASLSLAHQQAVPLASLPTLTPTIKTSSLSSAGAKDIEDIQPIPNLGKKVLITLGLTGLLAWMAQTIAPGLRHELIVHLPLQVLWTFSIYRISQALGRLTKSKPPLNTIQVYLLCFITFICLPVFDLVSHFIWFDPSFLVWATAQTCWVFEVGRRWASLDSVRRKYSGRFGPIELAVIANAYLLMPIAYFNSLIFNTFWFFSQFAVISLMNQSLGKDNPDQAVKVRKPVKPIADVGSDLVIRYRAFAGVERWLKQRMEKQSLKTGIRWLLVWVLGPIMLLVSLVAVGLFFKLYDPYLNPNIAPGAVPFAIEANVKYIRMFLLAFFGIGGLSTFWYLRRPTHIGLAREGWRFLWRHKLYSNNGHYMPWSTLAHVSVVHPEGKTSPSDERLRFTDQSGKRREIALGAIDSIDERESILKAIQKWAPTVSRDFSVEEALQPPKDYSYTELWLQALSAPPKRERFQPLIAGAVLREGHFQVIRSLGVGGQGQAYLALDTSSQKEVVLKEFILPVYVDIDVRRAALEQFENEARILRQLDNERIVKLIDFFVEDHRAYLVLEYIRGASLREIVQNQGKLPEKQVRALAEQMCLILSYLHKLNPPLVHRDFSPDNLVLNTDGTLKLIDFNVAKEAVESTTSGTVVGKHAYLPPEQFRGMPVVQSDIYALGATLYYLLTGHDPEPISVSRPNKADIQVSKALNDIVERATAIDLQARYKSIDELKSDLEVS